MTRKNLLIIIGVVLMGVVGVIAMVATDNRATLDIFSIIPDDIIVTIDGNRVQPTSKLKVSSGKHSLIGKRVGFETYNQSFDLKSREIKTVKLSLKPNGPAGYAWIEAHPDQIILGEVHGGQPIEDGYQRWRAKYPIVASLPVTQGNWSIDYGASPTKNENPPAMAITITYSSDTDKQKALDWIKNKKYNPDSYEIIYRQQDKQTGFTSLLDHGISSSQIDALKSALMNYYKTTGKDLHTIAVDPNSIQTKPRSRDSVERDEVSFTVALNDQTQLKARMEFFSIGSIRLYLSKSDTSEQVYDSKDISK